MRFSVAGTLLGEITWTTLSGVFRAKSNLIHKFRPILKLFDTLLLIGLMTDEDIVEFLQLLHPSTFNIPLEGSSVQNMPFVTNKSIHKGLCDIELAEGVKVYICMHSTVCCYEQILRLLLRSNS